MPYRMRCTSPRDVGVASDLMATLLRARSHPGDEARLAGAIAEHGAG